MNERNNDNCSKEQKKINQNNDNSNKKFIELKRKLEYNLKGNFKAGLIVLVFSGIYSPLLISLIFYLLYGELQLVILLIVILCVSIYALLVIRFWKSIIFHINRICNWPCNEK